MGFFFLFSPSYQGNHPQLPIVEKFSSNSSWTIRSFGKSEGKTCKCTYIYSSCYILYISSNEVIPREWRTRSRELVLLYIYKIYNISFALAHVNQRSGSWVLYLSFAIGYCISFSSFCNWPKPLSLFAFASIIIYVYIVCV